jgi:uncharacterized protein YprB with RNaseH-like and TPR domain
MSGGAGAHGAVAALVAAWRSLVPEDDALGSSRSRETLLDLPGAELREVAGTRVFALRRSVDELYPQGGVAETMRAGLARLNAEREATAAQAEEDGEKPEDLGPPFTLDDVVVLDLETAGFWSSPVFVSAMLLVDGGELATLQFVTRDYTEEEAVLRATLDVLQGRRLLLTFNGKSFDVPFLVQRSIYHRFEFDVAALTHLDLLHPARRLYRGFFSDCRLQTLERMRLGIRRSGDIESREIPAVFHELARTGQIERVKDVLHHNRIDVISTGMLLGKMNGER